MDESVILMDKPINLIVMSDLKIETRNFEVTLGDTPGDAGAFNLSGVFTEGVKSTDKGTFVVHLVQLDGAKGPVSISHYNIDEKNVLEISLAKGLMIGKYPVTPVGANKPLTIDKNIDLKLGIANNIFKHGTPYQSALIGGGDTRDSDGIKSINFLAADLQLVKGASITVQIQFVAVSQKRGKLVFRTANKEQLLLGTECAKDVLRVPYWGLYFDQVPQPCS